MEEASRIVMEVYSVKRLSDVAGIAKLKIAILASALLLALVYMFLIYFSLQNKDQGLEYFSYLVLMGAFSLIIGVSLFECMRKSDAKFMSFDDLVQK